MENILKKLAVSGYRGIWGETLNRDTVEIIAHAFATFIKKSNGKKVFIGRDARTTGQEIVDIITEVLVSEGIDVTVLGIVPTPTILFLVRNQSYDGAMIVTASHNPREYNGIKLVTNRGMFTNEKEIEKIKEYIVSKEHCSTDKIGEIKIDTFLSLTHVKHILENIDVELIKSKKFKVVLDPINSAGSIITPILLEKLGCTVTVINGVPNGDFAHMPEPLAINLTGLEEKVLEVEADIGFAQDPDADRLVLCDELGEIIFEEYGVAIGIQSALEKKLGDITVNLSTSKTIELLGNIYGVKTHKSKVGESNVVEKLLETNCVVGGEGGGGIIYPTINPCRDSLVGIALVLELLAKKDKKISELVEKLPKLIMMKNKFPLDKDLGVIYEKVKQEFVDGIFDVQDGLRIDFDDDSWVQIRASNTEPLVRIMGEAHTTERIEYLMNIVKNILEN